MKKLFFAILALCMTMPSVAQNSDRPSVGLGIGYERQGYLLDNASSIMNDFFRVQLSLDYPFEEPWGVTVDLGFAYNMDKGKHYDIVNEFSIFMAPYYEWTFGDLFVDLGLGLLYKNAFRKVQEEGEMAASGNLSRDAERGVSIGLEPCVGYYISPRWTVFVNARTELDFYNSRYRELSNAGFKPVFGGIHVTAGLSFAI